MEIKINPARSPFGQKIVPIFLFFLFGPAGTPSGFSGKSKSHRHLPRLKYIGGRNLKQSNKSVFCYCKAKIL
jgi:hypothetical protein